MVTIQTNVNLKKQHTFGFDSIAKQFIEINSVEDIVTLKQEGLFNDSLYYILGEGSNTLFMSDVESLIIKPCFNGIVILEQTNDTVVIEAGASVVWDDFVDFCVERGFYGVENLSHIPGSVGASVVQNVGAYGVEVGDVVHSVLVVNLTNGLQQVIKQSDCAFGYRDSIFKQSLKNSVIVTAVRYQLSKVPSFKLDYGQIADVIAQKGLPTLKLVRQTIVDIRQSKLPDPVVMGNAGSFFKNPLVSRVFASELKDVYSAMPVYNVDDLNVKIPAGWLIEQAGWKGKVIGNAGVHAHQALVLVNKGGATCEEVLLLASLIENDVYEQFGVHLEKEVVVVA